MKLGWIEFSKDFNLKLLDKFGFKPYKVKGVYSNKKAYFTNFVHRYRKLFTHDSFDELGEGQFIPTYCPIFKSCDDFNVEMTDIGKVDDKTV